MTSGGEEFGSAGSWDQDEEGDVLVVGAAGAIEAAVRAIGYEPLTAGTTDEALSALEAHEGIMAVFSDPGSIRSIAGELRRDGHASSPRLFVVAEPDGLEDALAALDAGAADVVPASVARDELRMMLAPAHRTRSVRDSSAMHGPRLAELSAEVGRLAKALASLSEPEPEPPVLETETGPAPFQVTANYLRGVIRARRARERYFPHELFADPAWDILLDLMAARLENKQVSVSSLCIAAAVPATTALRWIKSMTDAGLLVRRPDPVDGRRVFIDLSEEASQAMQNYLAAAARGTVSI